MSVVHWSCGRPFAATMVGFGILGWFPVLLVFSHLDVVSSGKHSNQDNWSNLPHLQAEFSVIDPNGIFFLRNNVVASSPSNQDNSTETFSEALLGVVHPQNHIVRALYGPFNVQQDTLRLNTSRKYYSHVDISTYIIKSDIRASNSNVKVVFHVTQGLAGHNNGATVANIHKEVPCLKLHLLYNEHKRNAACKPFGRKLICLAEVPVPDSWWNEMEHTGRDQIKVYYTIEDYEENSSCEQSSGNSIRVGTSSGSEKEHELYRIGDVTMIPSSRNFEMIMDDPHIWLKIPQRDLFPGSRFQISVVLPPNSTLSTFSIRAKAKRGVKFDSVHEVEGSGWVVTSAVNDKQSTVLINAEISQPTQLRSENLATICMFEFEVNNSTADSPDSVHISWRIDYEIGTELRNVRTTSEFAVNTGMIEALVPLRKYKDLVNSALLNGRVVTYPLSVFAVGYGSGVEDVTNRAHCVSVNPTILKVAEDCTMVYLDGTEVDGAVDINIMVHYDGFTKAVTFNVWIPELPLTITLTDDKLSLIKSWKVPETVWMERYPRNTDYSNPTSLLKEDTGREHERNRCHLRHQDAMVDVYTRFNAPDENTGHRKYLFSDSLMQRVTHLIQGQMKVADKKIAGIHGHQVIGLFPGTTNVEVLAPNTNDILGIKELTVASDKVSVIDLQVNLVTGLALSTKNYPAQKDVIVAKAVAQRALFAENQKGFIDITLSFDDGKTMSLLNADMMEYSIEMTSFDNIVAPSPLDHPPGLIALAEGTTGVLLKLKLPEACQKPNKPNKPAKELKATILYVNVEFTANGRYTIMNKTRNGFDPGILHTEPYSVQDGYADGEEDEEKEKAAMYDGPVSNNIPVEISNGEEDEGNESDYEPADERTLPQETTKLSELEIGMYALLGIFCIAIIVFLVNCILFAARYKSKRLPNDGRTVANAHDWVWLGKPPDCVPVNGSIHETIPLDIASSVRDAQADREGEDGEHGSDSEKYDGRNIPSGEQGNNELVDGDGGGDDHHDLENGFNGNNSESGYHSKSGSQEIRITINPGHSEGEEEEEEEEEEVVENSENTDTKSGDNGEEVQTSENDTKSSVDFSHTSATEELAPHLEQLKESRA
ncbi:transmembrane protein 132E-like [Glandiceps talaboti]